MTIANWCIVAACLLPIITVGIAKVSRSRIPRKLGGYDNHNPREWAAKQSGWQARAVSAQNNGFESLPLFIAGVILAQMAQADAFLINTLSLSFIGIRICYIALYLLDYPILRSIVWLLGVVVSIALVAIA
jgi:uncharacterized MAPEG superfamily protein